MARVKQVATKPRKFMGDAMKAAAVPKRKEKKELKLRTVMKKQRQWQNEQEKERERVLLGQSLLRKRRKWKGPCFETFCATKYFRAKKGIMAEHNAKMDMLINRLDRQEWFMKKMAQMLFGESFGKFGDFGSYPQGTAGPSNANCWTRPSGVKISKWKKKKRSM
ncbi:hypothetical protein GH714_011975 [Hevea brasiliensis]|uniref:Uncharacterized protein n=1 Tax=Hevea brasiliensis TaxID=3981 RepID=A0A6A6N2S6_HEVBR|nr:hypothetical protein GH714_011975 [Hevea brasiliensis]